MKSTLLEDTVVEVVDEALETAEDGVFVVAPDAATLEGLVENVDMQSPAVRLLADPDTLKTVLDDFLVASRAANHVDSGRLEIRSYERVANALVVSTDAVFAIVRGTDQVAGLGTDDETFVGSLNDRFGTTWRQSETYPLRTPPLSRVRETLESQLGVETTADFDAMLSSLEAARGTGDGIDEVVVSLLVAAKNENLLYDISKWGEDVGIASKATFSRVKTQMEEDGLIETEKVPIDVGRPRLRLRIADERLASADVDRMATIAESMLES